MHSHAKNKKTNTNLRNACRLPCNQLYRCTWKNWGCFGTGHQCGSHLYPWSTRLCLTERKHITLTAIIHGLCPVASVHNIIWTCFCNHKDFSVLISLIRSLLQSNILWTHRIIYIIIYNPSIQCHSLPFWIWFFSLSCLRELVLTTVTTGLLIRNLNLHPDFQSMSLIYLVWGGIPTLMECQFIAGHHACHTFTDVCELHSSWVTNSLSGMFLAGRTC